MTDRIQTSERSLNRWAAFLFAAVLGFPLLGGLFGWRPGPPLEEKRTPSPPPTLHRGLESWRQLPARFDRYVEDGFPGRAPLVNLSGRLRGRITGRIVGDRVLVGRRGWLFYAGQGALDDYRGLLRPSGPELDTILENLKARRDWLALMGMEYILVTAPAKWEIYPEFMPRNLNRVRRRSRLDDIMDHIRRNSDIRIVDLRPALREARAKGRVYHPDDTHWNDRGALAAARTIEEEIHRLFTEAARYSLPEHLFQEQAGPAGDLALMLGCSASRTRTEPRGIPLSEPGLEVRAEAAGGSRPGLRVFERPGRDGDPFRAVVYHDSFGDRFQNQLAPLFDRCVFVKPPRMDRRFLLEERPDIVIQELGQRTLAARLTDAPAESPGSAARFSRKSVSLILPGDLGPGRFTARALTSKTSPQFLTLRINGRPSGEWRIDTPEREYSLPAAKASDSGEMAEYRFDYTYAVDPSSPRRGENGLPFHLVVETGEGRCRVGFNGGVLPHGRGYNIYHISPRGLIRTVRNFDTKLSRERSRRLAEHLRRIQNKNGYLLIVSCSRAGDNLSRDAVDALQALGLRTDLRREKNRNHIALLRLRSQRVIQEKSGEARQEYRVGEYDEAAGLVIQRIFGFD